MEFDQPVQAQQTLAGGASYTPQDTLEMAIEFASKGDYDSALDLKLNVPDEMKKQIDRAIQGHKAEVEQATKEAAKKAPAERPRRSYNV